jgi:GNAT superfamily N-acetyltransferase
VDVRVARVDQLETVLDVLADATMWLHRQGIEQWPERFEPGTVLPSLQRGETWLATQPPDGDSFGTVTVQWVDELIWPEASGSAGYVHRLAVRRSAAGSGRSLLEWAEQHIAATGRSLARLDCWAGNMRLRRYYESLGYRSAGERSEATWVVARYEKPLPVPAS